MEKVKLIIDIEFIDGTHTWGIEAHSIEVRPDKHWQLYIYMTQEDIQRNPRLYWGVEKVTVVGVIDDEH